MLARKLRRAPAVIVTSVPGIIALAFLCEPARIIFRSSDIEIIRMIVVSLKEIAVYLWLPSARHLFAEKNEAGRVFKKK